MQNFCFRNVRILAVAFGVLSIAVGVAARETFPEWVIRKQVPASQRGMNDDPAGDGVSNILKYGLGLDPLVVATNLVPQAQVMTVQGVERLVLTVNKNADALGVIYTVEGSSDLAAWSSNGLIIVSDTPTTLTVADGAPLSQTNRRFLRLRVSLRDPLPGALSWEQVASIRSLLDGAISAYEIPGILYSIKQPGQEPWVDGRGVRDRNSAAPISPDDRFRIGSASKTFAGMAALRLINQGRLGFEHPIGAYLPANVLSNYRKDLITVRMLLQHMSGINNYTNIIDDWFIPYIMDRKRVWTNEELIELVNGLYTKTPEEGGKVYDPGQKWFYSNTNTVILALIIEKITGVGFGRYITENFIQPLGLTGTIYPAPGESEIPGNHTRGYVDWIDFIGEPSLPPGVTDVTVYDPTGVGPAGPMISTVRDLSIWMEAIVRNDALVGDLRRGHIDWRYYIAFNGATSGPPPGTYGIKLAHEPDYTNNADYYVIGHRGQISGYDTAMMYLPEKNASIVVVCNRTLKNGPGFPTNALEVALNKMVALLYPDLIATNRIRSEPGRAQSLRAVTAPAAPADRWPAPLMEYR